MNNLNDYYQVLGLEKGASAEEIRQAYLDLAKVWHPDRFTHDPKLQQKAQEKLKEINNAYEILRSSTSNDQSDGQRSEPQPAKEQDPVPPPEQSGEKASSPGDLNIHKSPRAFPWKGVSGGAIFALAIIMFFYW